MKTAYLLFIVFLSASLHAYSQDFKVTGGVIDVDNSPIIFANVVLLKAIDSTIIKGTSSDDKGKFVFDNVLEGKYILKASYIGNFTGLKLINVFENTDCGALKIINNEQQLDEVVVSFKKPTLERKVDRLVFNVAKTALAEGTIWELLKQTPSVNVVQGVLTIKGSGNIGVLINGKKVNLPESDIINLLSGTSASNVESIEVITNPPLKYSAEGGMLIDVKMKKNLVAGYNGAVFNTFEQAIFPKNTFGTDHYFKGKKIGLSVNYSFNNFKGITRFNDETNFFDNNTPSSLWATKQDVTRTHRKHNLNAFFDYAIDDNNSLSFSTMHTVMPRLKAFSDSNTLIYDVDGNLESSFNTINNADTEQLNSSFNGNWQHKLKKKGAEISIGTHYTYYDSKKGQDLNTDFFDTDGIQNSENDFITQSDQKINLYNIDADFVSPLGEIMRMEAGVRYAGITSESTIMQDGFDRNQPGIDPTAEAVFNYDETILAAYTSFNSDWDLWTLKTGLRAEYTETKGTLDTGNGTNKKSYFELFPSFGLQYSPSKKHQFNLSYSRRIQRPRYSSINPFQYFQSNNAVIEGNPDLLPGTRDWVSAEYSFDRDYSVTFFYMKWKNLFQEQTFQDNENNLLRFISTNSISNRGYGVDLTVYKDISEAWSFYLFCSFYNEEERFVDLDSKMVLSNSLWTGFARFNNYFTFLADKSLVADLNFAYFSPKILGNAKRESYNYLNLRVKKTFLDKKLSVSLGVEDIFNESGRFTSRKFLNQNNSSWFRYETRLFTCGLRYKFGNTRIRGSKKSKKVKERKRI